MKIDLKSLEADLKSAKNAYQLNQVLASYLALFNINTFAFTYYYHIPNSVHKLKYQFATPDYLLWHKHYIDSNYENIDSNMDTFNLQVLPVFWSVADQIEQAKTPREKQMRKDALEFGVKRGLSIPIHGPKGDFAILLLIDKEEKAVLNPVYIPPELLAVAYYYYHFIKTMLLKHHPPEVKFNLNSREMQCLTLLAKDHSVAAIATKLNISPRTVNYHIQRLNKKLGTKNKYQSIIKALQNALIKL